MSQQSWLVLYQQKDTSWVLVNRGAPVPRDGAAWSNTQCFLNLLTKLPLEQCYQLVTSIKFLAMISLCMLFNSRQLQFHFTLVGFQLPLQLVYSIVGIIQLQLGRVILHGGKVSLHLV